MNNNDTIIDIFRTIANVISNSIAEGKGAVETAASNSSGSINSVNNNSYKEYKNEEHFEASNIENEERVQEDNYNKACDNRNTTSNPQGVIDSIAEDLTSARLQQAIILSEIVGKPKSKTRKRRRF